MGVCWFSAPRERSAPKCLVIVPFLRRMIGRVGEHAGERHGQIQKDQGLHNSDEEFVKIEGNEGDESEVGVHLVDGIEEVFTAKDITVETEGEGDGTDDKNGEYLDPADEKENENEEEIDERIGEFDLRAKDVLKQSPEAKLANAPVEPHEKEDGGVGGGQIDVGIGTTEEGTVDFKIP